LFGGNCRCRETDWQAFTDRHFDFTTIEMIIRPESGQINRKQLQENN
jgi:hypothetical protein